MATIDLGFHNKERFKTLTTANVDDSVDSPRMDEVGIGRWVLDTTEGLKCYKSILIVAGSTPAIANGSVVVYPDDYRLTGDIRIAQAKRNRVAGVAVGVITAGNFGWLQTRGYHSVVKTNGDDDIADGDVIIHSGADGTVDSVAAGTAPTYIPIGVAVDADVDANNTVAAQLLIP